MRAFVAGSTLAFALVSCAAILGLPDPVLDETITPDGASPSADADPPPPDGGSFDGSDDGGATSFVPRWSMRFPANAVRAPIACDEQGNVFVAIRFSGVNRNFGGFVMTSQGEDIVVLEIASDGSKVVWASRISGDAAETPRAIAVDADGDVYVAGELVSGTADVSGNGTTIVRGPRNVPQGFIAKLTGDAGKGVWGHALSIDGNTTALHRSDCVALRAKAGNVAFGCQYLGAVTYPGKPIVASNDRAASVFGLLDRQSGEILSSSVIRSSTPAANTFQDQAVLVSSVDVDGAGVYAVGRTYATPSLMYDEQPVSMSAARGLHSGFVVKAMNGGTAGLTRLWARILGPPPGATGFADARSVSVDGTGAPYVGGVLRGGYDFGGGSASTNGGLDDTFVLKLDGNGLYQWAKPRGGPANDRFGNVAIGPSSRPIAFFDIPTAPPNGMLEGRAIPASNVAVVTGLDPASGDLQWMAARAATNALEAYDLAACGANGFAGTALVDGSIDLGRTHDAGVGPEIAVFALSP